MYCSKCGKEIPDDSGFCNACGTKVGQRQADPQKTSATQNNTKPKHRSVPWLGIVVIAIVGVILLSSFLDMSIPEIVGAVKRGEPLQNRGLYDFVDAVDDKKNIITIRKDDWDADVCEWERIESFLREYLVAKPELYYVDTKNTTIILAEKNGRQTCTLEMSYFDELTTETAAQRLESAANEMLRSMPSGSSDWEKALYLHDELIRHVTYENGTMDQTAYGALVDGKAVCMGYAMAYEYLLTKAGIECDTVIGYSDEMSAALDGTLLQMAQHAWTIVTFQEDGVERSYYVDTTWDDLGIADTYGQDYISHRWFCATQEDIDKEGRSTLQDGYDMSRWNLNDDTMNYYVYTNAVIDCYDLDEVIRIMQTQLAQGNNYLSLRMADMQTYYNLSYAMEHSGDFQKLCSSLGIDSCAYNYSYGALGDGLLCFNLFLNYPEQ